MNSRVAYKIDSAAAQAHHRRRLRAEKRFRLIARSALALACLMLVVLLSDLMVRGASGFTRVEVKLPVTFSPEVLGVADAEAAIALPPLSFKRLASAAMRAQFPELTDTSLQRTLGQLMSGASGDVLYAKLTADLSLFGQSRELWLPLASNAELYIKNRDNPSRTANINMSDDERRWLDQLQARGQLRTVFNRDFLTQGDSREAEQAGFLGAMLGSLFTMLVCAMLVLPVGVMTAVYLEEFARPGKWVDFIEVNINNLAAVPSIVFGLLGLALFLGFFGMPRSAPVVGGLTLALMVLPVVIITTRSSLRAVPPSIRDGARALGASPMQVVLHHTLPLATPGIMTGTILSMARAIGETAPLLMIGMVAFVADIPTGFTDSATVMPVQVYLWATSPEGGFVEKTAAGILVLLVLLLAMNALAIYIRKRYEIRW